jgi:hypothetical protein
MNEKMKRFFCHYVSHAEVGQKGSILILALIFMLLGSLIIAPLLSLTATGLKTGSLYNDKSATLYAADAGIRMPCGR